MGYLSVLTSDRRPTMKKSFLAVSILALACVAAIAQPSSTTSTSGGSSTSTSKSRGPIFRPTKDQIQQVQQILKDKKLYAGMPSGKYDDDTRTGIKSYQKDNGLRQTGTLNRATLEKFGVTLTDSQKAIPVDPNSFATADGGKTTKPKASSDGPKRPAPFRANSEQITAAQKILRDGKMLTGGDDGKLDDATRAGLKKYQEANKLNAAGTLNAATLDKMGIALTDAQKANVAAQAAYEAAKKP
jgi:peptidoglycan hydrolase-like protein with peptidoglycan-binding domain